MPKKKTDDVVDLEATKKVVVVEEIPEAISTDSETPNDQKKEEVLVEKEPVAVSEAVESVEEKPNYLWIIIPTALLVGALVGGLITYFSGIAKLNDTQDQSPVSTSTPLVQPTSTPTPSVSKREDIKIQVLNGSGTSGLAGKAKTYLESLGYKDVAVGNATSSDFSETEIQIKDSIKDFSETLISDLSKNYQVAKETKVLPASSKFDIIITLGKK